MIKPPLNAVDTQFEALLQDLPLEVVASAREFRAFTRARKLKTPPELLRVVLLYGGLDQSLRPVAGNLTLLGERITDSSSRVRTAHHFTMPEHSDSFRQFPKSSCR